jgi:Phasin protein
VWWSPSGARGLVQSHGTEQTVSREVVLRGFDLTCLPPSALSRLSVLHVNSPVESELRGLNFIGAAKKATDAAETLPFGAKDAVAKAMSFAENNVNAAFDLAQKLVRAKDVSEVLALQSEFAKSQMVAMQTQAKELGAVAQDAIASATRK